ncbi:NAC domain-containing protein 67 [Artemisia annua]|uniref:NAC domain-containing protein 67 n=1 Tax=Artemisia annua TaxID=35608 RepID=A0A2U1MK73_ARTAN|nr:NAC domain-containing protein 67 [Artemisia annua]
MTIHFEEEEVEYVGSNLLEAEDVESDTDPVSVLLERDDEPPIGYYPKPTDQDITRLLKMMILKLNIKHNVVYVANIYSKTPESLTRNVPPSYEDCYLFFTQRWRDLKTQKFLRIVGDNLGLWEANGSVFEIKDDSGKVIGLCSSFSFKSKKGTKRLWRMIEYSLPPTSKLQNPDDNVICKIFKVDTKGVATREHTPRTVKEPTTRTRIIAKRVVKKGFSQADKSVAAGLVLPNRLRSGMRAAITSRSEKLGNLTFVVPIRKRTPRFDVRAAARRNAEARTTAAAARREGNSAGSEGHSRFGDTRRITARQNREVTSGAKGKGVKVRAAATARTCAVESSSVVPTRVRVESSAKEEGTKIVDQAAVRTRKASMKHIRLSKTAAPRLTTDADSGEGTSMVDETRSRTYRERAAIDATGEGASRVVKDSAFRISSNVLEDLQVENID